MTPKKTKAPARMKHDHATAMLITKGRLFLGLLVYVSFLEWIAFPLLDLFFR